MKAVPRLGPALLLAAAGCQSMAGADDVPARIVAPTDASRAALGEAVNTALRTDVLLADDALTQSDVLAIERKAPQGIGVEPALGRNTDPPILFRLVMNGKVCVLIDQRDATRYELADTECTPL